MYREVKNKSARVVTHAFHSAYYESSKIIFIIISQESLVFVFPLILVISVLDTNHNFIYLFQVKIVLCINFK